MFNPNEHMMKLKGKDYLQVAWRLVWFREDHPDFGINAEALDLTEDHAIFKATITDANGIQLSSGHGSESKKDFGDFIEKAETKAIGRALAMLGYGTQFAADELDEGERIVDSPINRTPNAEARVETIPANAPVNSFDPLAAFTRYCNRNKIDKNQFAKYRQSLIDAGIIKDIPLKEQTADQFTDMCRAVETNFAGELWVAK